MTFNTVATEPVRPTSMWVNPSSANIFIFVSGVLWMAHSGVQWRFTQDRVFSRFDQTARNYLAFVHFASMTLWLR